MQEYVPSDIPIEPLKAHLSEDLFIELDTKTSPGRTYPSKPVTDEVENDILPNGATLTLTTPDDIIEEREPTMALTRDKFLGIIRRMLGSEEITQRQAMEMRRRFGISNASFHAKKVDAKKRKKAKKLARWNRRVNRLNGSTKGQTKQHYHKK